MKKAIVSVKLEVTLRDDGSVEIELPKQIFSAAEFKEVRKKDDVLPVTLTLRESHKQYNYITFLKQDNSLDFGEYDLFGKTFDVYFIDRKDEFDSLHADSAESLRRLSPDTSINAHKTINRRFDSASGITRKFKADDTVYMKLFTHSKIIAVKAPCAV